MVEIQEKINKSAIYISEQELNYTENYEIFPIKDSTKKFVIKISCQKNNEKSD